MLKRMLITVSMLSLLFSHAVYAGSVHTPPDKPEQDSKELMYQDMLMLFLLPHMQQKIDEIYAPLLKSSPEIYPYFVDVQDVQRVNGFRGFHFLITLNVVPTVGPHIAVGEDRLTFDISPVNPHNVKLISWKHLKDPKKSDFPPNYQDLLKR
ncbi:Protein of unknown function [Paenibacillus catalpae]|uniref:DUF3888 domain-containing protein n=1 Tax=Paenibacillus catalpae TaxID=1045775 RepID=A0A1I2BXE2_9BACL|nr:DUF3888 domain-containing protein [Paenibacillus catalpae]SFE60578.1 Protein of unknown function [Paenibacillus catalpae]